MSKEITGPIGKLTNVEVRLGPRVVMVGNEVLGYADILSIRVAEGTQEEVEKMTSAPEIRLVRRLS